MYVSSFFPGGADAHFNRDAQQMMEVAQAITDEFATETWTPLHVATDVDYFESLALMAQADIFFDSAIRGGMSIIALEAIALSETAAPLVLSRSTGAAQHYGSSVQAFNPYDVSAAAKALHTALSRDPTSRHETWSELMELVGSNSPRSWFTAQLDAFAGTPSKPASSRNRTTDDTSAE